MFFLRTFHCMLTNIAHALWQLFWLWNSPMYHHKCCSCCSTCRQLYNILIKKRRMRLTHCIPAISILMSFCVKNMLKYVSHLTQMASSLYQSVCSCASQKRFLMSFTFICSLFLRSGPKIKHRNVTIYDPLTMMPKTEPQQIKYYQKDIVR